MRVILGALLLEAVLGVTLVPLSFVNMISGHGRRRQSILNYRSDLTR